jgi:hypothetical protein
LNCYSSQAQPDLRQSECQFHIHNIEMALWNFYKI